MKINDNRFMQRSRIRKLYLLIYTKVHKLSKGHLFFFFARIYWLIEKWIVSVFELLFTSDLLKESNSLEKNSVFN